MQTLILAALLASLCPAYSQAKEPDWNTPSANPYQWDEQTLPLKIQAGQKHALEWPVTVTGMLLPKRQILKTLELKPGDPLFGIMKSILSLSPDFQDFNGFWDWLGLNNYPESDPHPYPMGVSIIHRNGTDGFTLSCAACHSSNLFGTSIIGMTNRFPRSNLFFIHGQRNLERMPPGLFAALFGADDAEKAMYAEARERIRSIGLQKPQALGLDASPAQVALSLAKRAKTPDAERTAYDASHPSVTILDHTVMDSKPAVWWNVKYKTHWLSDGSVMGGNPVFTNFLWNELGRGVDIPDLAKWMDETPDKIEELTTAVFASEAPKWRDFFGENSIQIERAKRGEKVYIASCRKCHGEYVKDWAKSTDTVQVNYDETVRDVGTDPKRYQGMQALADALNPLAFSKKFNIVIEPHSGYVPPPLVGIWARYPYLHNNSIPNLCAFMLPPDQRPKTYYSRKALDRNQDYDQECMGYPIQASHSREKPDPEHLFDTGKEGLSNAGHYDRIFSRLDAAQKRDLIEFLKTL